jgi:hypothetical protein
MVLLLPNISLSSLPLPAPSEACFNKMRPPTWLVHQYVFYMHPKSCTYVVSWFVCLYASSVVWHNQKDTCMGFKTSTDKFLTVHNFFIGTWQARQQWEDKGLQACVVWNPSWYGQWEALDSFSAQSVSLHPTPYQAQEDSLCAPTHLSQVLNARPSMSLGSTFVLLACHPTPGWVL